MICGISVSAGAKIEQETPRVRRAVPVEGRSEREADQARHRKQRPTAKRLYERLQEEHGYRGGYTIGKDYLRLRKRSQGERFVPLPHPPGDAQADFGEALVVIGGVEQKAPYLVVDLPQSDDGLGMGFPASLVQERREAKDEKRLLRFPKLLASFQLRIIAELGFLPLSKTGAEMLWEIFSLRYERGATMVTSNLPFNEWTAVLSSERLGTVAIGFATTANDGSKGAWAKISPAEHRPQNVGFVWLPTRSKNRAAGLLSECIYTLRSRVPRIPFSPSPTSMSCAPSEV